MFVESRRDNSFWDPFFDKRLLLSRGQELRQRARLTALPSSAKIRSVEWPNNTLVPLTLYRE